MSPLQVIKLKAHFLNLIISGFAAIIEGGHVQQSGDTAQAVAVIKSLFARWTRSIAKANVLQGSIWQTTGRQSDRGAGSKGQHACNERNAGAVPDHRFRGLQGQG